MTARAIVLLDGEDNVELKRWVTAAAIVLAAHLGLMATYFLAFSHVPAGAPAPIIIDMVPMAVSPASPVDVAPGPEMQEAPPPPPVPEIVEPVPPEPLIEPPPPMIEPLVALPEPPKEPPPPPEVKEEPKVKPLEVKRVDRKKPAPRTTAAPRSERATAATPAAQSPGAASASAAMASWRDLVVAQLQRAKRYPSGAESRREQGVVTLNFTLSRSGAVLSRSIARSSGSFELDQEVLGMVARASPFPQFPPGMTQSSVNLSVPVRFSLR
jgi:periplasmic protein TonB